MCYSFEFSVLFIVTLGEESVSFDPLENHKKWDYFFFSNEETLQP